MSFTVAFMTGANQGLGLGLVKHFVARPNYVFVAAVRDPAHPTVQKLSKLPTGEGSSIIVVKYNASVEQSAFDAVKEATDKGIDHVDYVVANAGIAKLYPLVKDAKRADIVEHLEVNVLSSRQPPVPSAAYGASKSVLPWYAVRINAEDEWLNTFVLDPGWVQTDMGNAAAKGWGLESAPDSVEATTSGMVDIVTKATKEQYGGKVVLYTGEVQEW